MDVGLAALPPAFEGALADDGWDTLGRWYAYVLLRPVDGAEGVGDVRSLVAAWDGDRVLFVSDPEGGAAGFVWASAWDDADAAGRATEAIRRLHGATLDVDAPSGTAEDGEPMWLERRGDRVVAIRNVDPALAEALADAAFLGPQPDDASAAAPASAPDVDASGHRERRRVPMASWLTRLVGPPAHAR